MGAGACWAVYVLTGQRAGENTARDGRLRLTNCRRNICLKWNGTNDRLNMAVVNPCRLVWQFAILSYDPALLSGDDRLTRLPTRILVRSWAWSPAARHLRNDFLGETLTTGTNAGALFHYRGVNGLT